MVADEQNVRRATRAKELELAGAASRGSIWHGDLRYETTIVYLRPEKSETDEAIANRSRRIAREGLDEAQRLRDMLAHKEKVNPSVMDSVGVRELMLHLVGTLTLQQAEDLIAARTRRFARRQVRWFDKLMRTLEGRARIAVVGDGRCPPELHNMHDIIGV
jgi:tRNA dimethylallyltransferase